jgi:hypothetical protein
METIPENGITSLFKFKYFDSKGYYKDLLQNKIYFASPTQLNDPFDSKILMRYDLCSKRELFELIKKSAPEEYQNINRKSRRRKYLTLAKIRKKEIISNPYLFNKRVADYMDNTIGIFSLTEKLTNLLLWSYYANGHKGFCVEFSAEKLRELLINVYLKGISQSFIVKIKYLSSYPIIKPSMDYKELIELQFSSKSIDWSHEKEWRIITISGEKLVKIPPDIIKNVYFGLLATEANIKSSIEILNKYNPNVGLFKAEKKKYEFGLEFKKIN